MPNQPKIQSQTGDDQLSALADGQLRGEDFAAAVRHATTAGSAQAQWHAYHVIGDVMRSQELADASGDMAFLKRFEARLANEPKQMLVATHAAVPVVARLAANSDVFRWKVVAGFASFAAVAAIGWQSLQLQLPLLNGASAVLAQESGASQGGASQVAGFQQVRADVAGSAENAMSSPGNPPVMLRNAQLDELLAAHNRAVGGAALQSQVRLLRNVSVTEDFSR